MAIAAFAVAASVASSATPPKRYYELAVDARFTSEVDYGKDEAELVVGSYSYVASWQLRAVVVFENRNLRIPEGAAVIGASVRVQDYRRKLDASDPLRKRRVPVCPGWGSDNIRGIHTGPADLPESYRLAPSAGVSIGDGRLRISPALPIKWKLGCTDVESLERHRLQAGPDAKVRAPPYARFRAGLASSLACANRAEHGASDPHGVEYGGEVAVRVRFAPIAESKLEVRFGVLKNMTGKASRNSLHQSGNKGKPCI